MATESRCLQARWLIFSFSFVACVMLFLIISENYFIENDENFHITELNFLKLDTDDNQNIISHHIINMTFSENDTTYSLHLFHPYDLFDSESLGPGFQEVLKYPCVYSAKVLLNDIIVGRGSVSSCHVPSGLEGFISLGNEHYQIIPNLMSINTPADLLLHNRIQRSILVQHKMAKVVATEDSKSRGSDVKRASSEVIHKAYEEMLKDQEILEDEKEEDDETENKSLKKSKSKLSPRSSSKVRKKVKRKLAKVVELAVFTDETFYKKWEQQYPSNTLKKIKEFVLALVNNMNYLYAQPSMKQKVTFRLVHVGIQKTTPSEIKASSNGDNYLDSFCNFAGKKDKKGAIWDHAMMLTGIDLKDPGNLDLLGIAFSSTMCLRYLSCSLVKFTKGFDAAFTATHEVGHTLGMDHDGEYQNKKCNPSKFIMAAVAGKGQINWSRCSNENIKTYLASGDPRPKVKAPKMVPRCLTKRGSKKSRIKYRTSKLPGQVFTAGEQCDTVCNGCTPHVTSASPFNNICWMLHCKNQANKIFAAHPALEGTACGTNKKKWCRNGKCQ